VNLRTTWRRGSAVRARKLATELPAKLEEQLGVEVGLDCGREPLAFLNAEGRVACALISGKTTSTLRLTFNEQRDVTGWQLDPPLLGRAKLEQILTPSVQAKLGPAAQVSCGPEALLRRPDDGVVRCDVND